MDMLRLSLIIVGALIVAGVYWWSRRETDSATKKSSSRITPPVHVQSDSDKAKADLSTHASFEAAALPEPELDAIESIVPERDIGRPKPKSPASRPAGEVLYATTSGEELIISLTIMGHHGQRFTGEAVLQVMQDLRLQHGEMRIFHYFAAESTRVPVLSVANIMEPGIFDLDKMQTFDTPGLVVFLRLPGPLEARTALETLLTIGRSLAERLHGDLCDESRSLLTQQTIGYLREKVEAFRFKQKMSQLGARGE